MMEFHGDAADLDRLFVVESPPANESDLDRTDEFPVLILDEQDAPVEPQGAAEPAVGVEHLAVEVARMGEHPVLLFR